MVVHTFFVTIIRTVWFATFWIFVSFCCCCCCWIVFAVVAIVALLLFLEGCVWAEGELGEWGGGQLGSSVYFNILVCIPQASLFNSFNLIKINLFCKMNWRGNRALHKDIACSWLRIRSLWVKTSFLSFFFFLFSSPFCHSSHRCWDTLTARHRPITYAETSTKHAADYHSLFVSAVKNFIRALWFRWH